MMRVLSLGAGVQSSTLALMIAAGEIPMVDAAIFADTQAEPKAVYEWLDWLEKQLPFPVYRVTKGNLAEDATRPRTSKTSGNKYLKPMLPVYVRQADGELGMTARHCTLDYKITVIQRETRRLRSMREGRPDVEMVLGISIDEALRMKPSRVAWIKNDYPLVTRGISRRACLEWMHANKYPAPPRSACVFCPYHNDAEWQSLKERDPAEFSQAVDFEKALQQAAVGVLRGVPYLHRSAVPLDQVDFNPYVPQIDMFNNECEGMCGV